MDGREGHIRQQSVHEVSCLFLLKGVTLHCLSFLNIIIYLVYFLENSNAAHVCKYVYHVFGTYHKIFGTIYRPRKKKPAKPLPKKKRCKRPNPAELRAS